MKRIISLLLVVTLLAGTMMLTSCGKQKGASTSSNTNGEQSGKVHLITTVSSAELGDPNIYKKFMDLYPNIVVEEMPMSNNDSKLLSMIASGNPPDIIRYMGYDEMPVFIQRGLLLPLDDYIKESGVINLDELYEITDVCRHDGINRGKGSLYGLPKDWSPIGLWINKDAFAEAGLPLPSETEPMTWDEFAVICKKLVKMENGSVLRHGCISALKFPTLLEMYLNSYGESFWNDDYSSTTINSAKTREAIDFFKELHECAGFASGLYPSIDGTGFNALVENKVGVAIGGYWFCGAQRSAGRIEMASENLMFVPAPIGDKEASYVVDITCLGIFSQTDHPKEAYQLWEFLVSHDLAVDARAKIGYGLPIKKSKFDILPSVTDFDKQALRVVTEYQMDSLDLSPRINPYISYTSLSALFDKYYLPVLFGKGELDDALKTIGKETEILVEEGKELVGVN